MPNGDGKKLNFTFKVWDEKANDYRPVYIAPDGTDTVQGDVLLSDATDSELDAASGMTAASPKAVKAVADVANNKLDKIDGADQTVASKVTFSNAVVADKGVTVPEGNFFTGNLEGNATTATTLRDPRKISVKVGTATEGSATFNGGADAAITIPQVDASTVTTGMLPLSVVPQGAMERLVKVADEKARFALTADDVQLGDSVLQLDTNVMYVVVDATKLSSADGYQEYSAGMAARVQHGLTVQKNGKTQFVYDGSAEGTVNIASDFSDLTGQIALKQIPDGLITNDKVTLPYAAGDVQKGVSLGLKIEYMAGTAIDFKSTSSGAVGRPSSGLSDDAGFNGSVFVFNCIKTTEDDIKNGPDLSQGQSLTGFSIVPINSSYGPYYLMFSEPDALLLGCNDQSKDKVTWTRIGSILDGSITTAKLADDSVTLTKLAADVGTVAVQADEPTDTNVKIWVKVDKKDNTSAGEQGGSSDSKTEGK